MSMPSPEVKAAIAHEQVLAIIPILTQLQDRVWQLEKAAGAKDEDKPATPEPLESIAEKPAHRQG